MKLYKILLDCELHFIKPQRSNDLPRSCDHKTTTLNFTVTICEFLGHSIHTLLRIVFNNTLIGCVMTG